MLRVSPADSDPEGGWLLDTTVMGTDAGLWQGEVTRADKDSPHLLHHHCGADPLEYSTLFDNKGFVFNICQPGPPTNTLQVPTGLTVPRSPSREQLATLLDPASPGHRQLAAVLRAPLPPPWPSPHTHMTLLRWPEEDPGRAERELAAPRGRFLRAATTLHSRLLDLNSETSCLLHRGCCLRQGFQEALTKVDQLLCEARRLQQDLRDILYLNDLLWLLRGRLERVSRREWPFLVAHQEVLGEVNLVV